MATILEFFVDDIKYELNSNSQNFYLGDDVVFSSPENDLSYKQKWYKEGFTVEDFIDDVNFGKLKNGTLDSIKKILEEEFLEPLDGFSLEEYHKFVCSNERHYSVVSKTRSLDFSDFNFDIREYIKIFEDILGFELTNSDPLTRKEIPIILRINRPRSRDYNPPHKDIYEVYDGEKKIPKFINIWIPICGVNEKSSLPISQGSHLINESKISRTLDGGILENSKYRVRLIKEWGDNKLTRVPIKYGQALIFSSHLIHGLATNENEDLTRIALEFRLYEKEKNI